MWFDAGCGAPFGWSRRRSASRPPGFGSVAACLAPCARGNPRRDGSVRAHEARGRPGSMACAPSRPCPCSASTCGCTGSTTRRRGSRRLLRPRHVRDAVGLVFFFGAVGLPALSRVHAGRPDGLGPGRRAPLRAPPRGADRAAYWVATLGTIALLGVTNGTPGVRLPAASDLPLFAVFGQNYSLDTIMRLNPVTWTLCVEAAFYILLPLLGALAWRVRPALGVVRRCWSAR